MGRREKREKRGGTEARDWTSQADLPAAAAPSALCWARTSTLHGPGLVSQEERPLEPWKGLCQEAGEGSQTAVELHGSSGEQPGERSRAAEQVTSPSQRLAEQGSNAGLGRVIARGPPL